MKQTNECYETLRTVSKELYGVVKYVENEQARFAYIAGRKRGGELTYEQEKIYDRFEEQICAISEAIESLDCTLYNLEELLG